MSTKNKKSNEVKDKKRSKSELNNTEKRIETINLKEVKNKEELKIQDKILAALQIDPELSKPEAPKQNNGEINFKNKFKI